MLGVAHAVGHYGVVGGVGLVSLWRWDARRDQRNFEAERRKTPFHCIRCDTLYTAPGGTELCRCPKCGHENTRLKFLRVALGSSLTGTKRAMRPGALNAT